MMKLIVAFRNFSKAPKNEKWKRQCLWNGQPTGCRESHAGTARPAASLLHEASRHILECFGNFKDFSSYKHSRGDTANLRNSDVQNRVNRGETHKPFTQQHIPYCISYELAFSNRLVSDKKCHTLQCIGTRSMSTRFLCIHVIRKFSTRRTGYILPQCCSKMLQISTRGI